MDIVTFGDLVEHAVDYVGGSSADVLRDARRCVLQAYRALTNARPWSYLATHGRIVTSAPYSTGTIAYDHAGGTYPREVLLAGGTWPAWAGLGAHLRLGGVVHAVAERRSDASLSLDEVLNPGADVDLGRVAIEGLTLDEPQVVTSVGHGLETGDVVILEGVGTTVEDGTVTVNGPWTVTVLDDDAFELDDSDGTADDAWDSTTGTWRPTPTTTYTLYRDVYLLPADFVAADTAMYEENFGGLEFSGDSSWLLEQRYSESSGTPRAYAITGDVRFPGRLVFRLSPYPDQAKTIDFVYTRRPRDLRTLSYEAGTVSNEAGGATVTGDGTEWTAAMAGSVLRMGTTRALPTSWIGATPPAVEVRILEVVSPTELRVESPVAAAHSEVRYIISDPVDIEQGAMLNALLRGIEKHLHIARSIKEKPDAFAAYDMALREAQAADSRSVQGRRMGGASPRRLLKKDMPADFS